MKKHLEHFIVVDDDPTNNMICQLNIQRFQKDANIQLFTSPEEALFNIEASYIVLKEDLPTILFLDINMPTMTGWEFLDAFSELPQSVKRFFKVFILTSAIQDFEKEKAKYPFVIGFLSKPLTKNMLQELFESSPKEDLLP